MDRVDAVVIGAGAVGSAVARALAQAGRETIVAEAQSGIGQGVSSRNSEVIHAGLYYAPGSLKARLCVRGKELLYALCESHGVAHRRCGKLTVANSEGEVGALRALQERAAANGVEVEWLDGAQARAMEPALRCIAALHSPSTGIVDSHGFMLALQGDLERAGGAVAFDSAVDGATLSRTPGEPHVLRLADGSELGADIVVNAASLHACSLARRFDGLDARFVPRESFAKGNYYALSGKSPFSRLIYPAPADAWLGVHLTLDLGGRAKFGPDIEWLDVRTPEEIDYRVDPARADGFYAEVRRYWPGLPDGALAPSYSGVRPKIHTPGEKAPDFRIDGPELHGVPGLLNLFGVESPGLTSALAIAEYARTQLSLP
ncbi:NAD(P)/FAD-dependent oxidoreductase [Ramlibacter terrae]|uniref:NAD(P)/FAD-dependent oxidoreductase n=1 Tax=Ramlibacter terrae TaxID=2732511 RepID=A0ABX6P5D8_9BURK|nr:NAD(P)/FAD-dependent oxidoreductase [Ramlibacter terrae]